MIYTYSDKGFYLIGKDDKFYSDVEIINLIFSDKEVILDFRNCGKDCLFFLYYSYYPVLLKNLLKIGKYTWVNPTVHLNINKHSLPQDILE